MNILVLTSEYPYEKFHKPDWTSVVAYFAKAWVKQGHRVVVIVNSSRFPEYVYLIANCLPKAVAKMLDVSVDSIKKTGWAEPFSFVDDGVEVFNIPIKKIAPGGRFSNSVLNNQVEHINDILKTNNFEPDVITGHWINPQLFLLSKLKKDYKCNFGFVFHADYVEKKCRKFKVNDYIGDIDRVGCRSQFAANTIQKYVKLEREPFVCFSGIPDYYIGANQKDFNIQFNDSVLNIVSVGRLVKYKNFDKLIKACRMAFPEGGYSLRIIGSGSQYNSLQKLIEEKEDTISLIGQLSREEVQDELEKANVFALISNNETLGLVYLEAMAKGCIVIGSKNGGIDGIIIDGVNGYLCEQGNEEELSKCLRKIKALSREEKQTIASNAIAISVDYTDSKVAEMYLDNIIN